jgi:hypothetical protein
LAWTRVNAFFLGSERLLPNEAISSALFIINIVPNKCTFRDGFPNMYFSNFLYVLFISLDISVNLDRLSVRPISNPDENKRTAS